MIKYNPKNWFGLIFAFRRSDTLRILWKEILYIGAFSAALSYVIIEHVHNLKYFESLLSVYSLIGFVISLLLVFRTNTAYDRWWEGRKKWGELVNNSRNLAIKISALTDDPEIRAYFKRMISNYVFAMKEHLREGVKLEELDLTDEEKKELSQFDHKPNYIAQKMYAKLHAMKQSGKLTEENYIVIDVNLKTFSDIIGACERIKNTPIPYSYSMFLKKFIFIYVTTLPLAFVNTFGYYSSLVSIFVFYVLVSMEILAEEIEDPFGKDDNDLPTDDLCQKIKANVSEVLQ